VTTLDQKIRERLDFALHEDWCGEDDEGCNCFLGPANDAIRAVLAIHEPRPLTAGVHPAMFGDGNCAFCPRGYPLVKLYEGQLHGHGPQVPLHDHEDPDPSCATCAARDREGYERWPCPTVQALATALGISQEATNGSP
jgi:hypothetical protein